MNSRYSLGRFSEFSDRIPIHKLVKEVDLVVIKDNDKFSVLYGRCLHRGALMSDGYIDGDNIICGLHNWDYRIDSGVSEYNNKEALHKFSAEVKNDELFIDLTEIDEFIKRYPQPFKRDIYLGEYADTHPEAPEPHTAFIQELAIHGLKRTGHHGPSASMGVDRGLLPDWNTIQFLPAQLSKKPLLDSVEIETSVTIGVHSKKPLKLNLPLIISDMSFGSLSREAKISLAMGAEMAGTGICSGEGGMMPEEQACNSKYFYEYASGKFGFEWEKLKKVQAFHYKCGQGAKTGTGGHLPGTKMTKEIADVRGLVPGQDAISPATFEDLVTVQDFLRFNDQVKVITGGIPIGFKMAASHVEADLDFALEAGAEYIILDGRGGGTGSAPKILRDHINVPTIPALARAKNHLIARGANNVSLIITGGLRVPEDFAKALMLGADAVAISNSALQAIGCVGMRACGSNNCPVGIATQKENLRNRLIIEASANRLHNFLTASNELIKVISRACGHQGISDFNKNDLTTFDFNMHRMSGIKFGGLLCL